MTQPTTPPAEQRDADVPPPPKSKLSDIGVLVFLLGFAAAPVRTSFERTRATLLLSEALTVCFFIGIGMMIIGGLRNRRARKAAKPEA